MESWCFDSLDKGYVSNETISPSDSIIRTKNVLTGWEFKAPFSYENSMLVQAQNSVANPGFPEVGFAEIIRKQFPHDSTRNVLDNDAHVGDMIIPSLVTSNAISGDEESSSKLSSSVVDSNSRESSLIDLKLGGFGSKPNSVSPRTAPVLSSAESSTPAKRARVTSLSSQTAYCQVYGCNKDLSSAKDYHKRHKVCDVHSKTSKVIVNGIEQRFCQQCSRFHLLGEFDDGKRSCRKRLAGHNERRRKPQVGYNSRSERSFQSYTGSVGSKFQGTTLTATSFICQDILPNDPKHTEKYVSNDWGRSVKVEDGSDYSQKFSYICVNGQVQHKSVFVPHPFEKPYAPLIGNINNSGPENVFSGNINPYPQEIVSRSLLQAVSLGSEDITLFDAASTVQGLPGISDSGCALSLLSSQSQNTSGHSSGVPGAHRLIIPSNSPHYGVSEASEKLLGVSSSGLTSRVQNRCPSYSLCSTRRNHLSSMPMLNNGATANSDFGNGILQPSEFMNAEDRLSCKDGTTIDLLQLSSQLQRVENERQSAPLKQETEPFCCLRIS